jgi:hypothetical protein
VIAPTEIRATIEEVTAWTLLASAQDAVPEDDDPYLRTLTGRLGALDEAITLMPEGMERDDLRLRLYSSLCDLLILMGVDPEMSPYDETSDDDEPSY